MISFGFFKKKIKLYCTKQHKTDDIPTIITPRGSAKPESDANLNACHLLGHIQNKKVIIQFYIITCTTSFNIATKNKI